MRTLSRLKSLQAFEAAARHGSFVGAATELHVTAAAVGQLVRSLESWLGSPLFHRRSGNERLVPTDEARAALVELTDGLDRLEAGLRLLTARPARGTVTVSASQAIVATWLLPLLDAFGGQHRTIDVRLDVTDRVVDVANNAADIGIRCGPGAWDGLLATRIMDEEIIAVCAPSLLPANETSPTQDWLSGNVLIHDTMPQTSGIFPSWVEWLDRIGMTAPRRMRGPQINDSTAVIQAAIAGQGVALVRHALVRQHLETRRLSRVFPDISWPIEWGYYVVVSPRSLRRPEVAGFHAFLVTHWDQPQTRTTSDQAESPDG